MPRAIPCRPAVAGGWAVLVLLSPLRRARSQRPVPTARRRRSRSGQASSPSAFRYRPTILPIAGMRRAGRVPGAGGSGPSVLPSRLRSSGASAWHRGGIYLSMGLAHFVWSAGPASLPSTPFTCSRRVEQAC